MVALAGAVLAPGDDYTATNGTSVVLTVGATAGQVLTISAFEGFTVADSYTVAETDAAIANHSADTTDVHGIANTALLATRAYADAAGGLILIASASLSGASVSINDCFSATYENYRIVISADGAVGAALDARLRVLGSDATGANYNWQGITPDGTSVNSSRSTGQTSIRIGDMAAGSQVISVVDISRPFIAAPTSMIAMSHSATSDNTSSFGAIAWGMHNLSTSYTGITFIARSTTFDAGTVRIYGYRNS